jgi:hypothetical protein
MNLAPKNPGSVAIVSTLRSPGRSLESWVRWHASIGVERVYLFFDADPSEADGARVAALPGVRVVTVDRRVRARMQRDPYCARLLPHAGDPALPVGSPEELTARQLCNAALGLAMARRENIAWLLHIDGDELFLPPDLDAKAHFARLDGLGIGYAIYDNHEALCEQAEYQDPFREITLFKKNPRAVDPDVLAAHDEYFRRRGGYFLAYANGKAAARTVAGALPAGVHGFHVPLAGGFGRCRLSDPAVLHYPYTGFDGYWRKFKRLGHYAGDVLLGRPWWPPPFELRSRDLSCADREAQARAVYKRSVILRDRRKITALLEAGVLARIHEPAQRLQSMEVERVPRG